MTLEPERYPSKKSLVVYRDFLFRHKDTGDEKRLKWCFSGNTNIFTLDDEIWLVEGVRESSGCFLDYALGLQLDGYKIVDNAVDEIWVRPT